MKLASAIYAVTEFGNDIVPFSQALRDIKECGFDSVMLLSHPTWPVLKRGEEPKACLLNLTESDWDLVQAEIAEAGLQTATIFDASIAPQEPEDMAANIDRLRATCAVAAALGCRYVGHSAPGAGPETALAQKQAPFQRLAEVVDTVAHENPQTQFAVDVHYGGLIASVADCEYYLQQLAASNAGVLLNTGHMTTCRQRGWELAQKYPDRTPIISWKDHTAGPPKTSVQLGTGDTPFEKYVEVIKPQSAERVHTIGVELEQVPLAQRKAALRESRQYLEEVWDRA